MFKDLLAWSLAVIVLALIGFGLLSQTNIDWKNHENPKSTQTQGSPES